MTLFKFRKISPRNRINDIIKNERLYASKFEELNDPMEGVYISSGLTPENIHHLKDEKLKRRIVSLSKKHSDGFMWVFYANECRGCCIEVEPLPTNEWLGDDISYNAKISKIKEDIKKNYLSVVDQLLTSKLKRWKYEAEVRYMKECEEKEQTCYLPVKIIRIYLGHKIANNDEIYITNLINQANKKRQINDKIEIIKMDREDYLW